MLQLSANHAKVSPEMLASNGKGIVDIDKIKSTAFGKLEGTAF